ncbi:MAG: hypothetical protein HN726_00765 [Candidatus Magasanikbacteria bacterium]|nr:hypothetical protein [Candidatus Magasanikbacteria bacterium]MBT4220675.1 hypothetical protein [Candidatus Magasanikbacteria bacterium]MBT4350377.1 hypothetical protein [Candidatus Magasanikbacteria bacterium]MBT4541827.1 hypothetical protein [Candidatus Magasanikbacteria bacterium]MBT6252763.1 hypothetical protein [Candidatus Magasanikbacteria bacterium]
MSAFDHQYQTILTRIMDEGHELYDPLHDIKMKALPGLTMELDIEKDGLPILTLRKMPLRLCIAEQIWFLMGEKNPDIFLGDFTKIWHDFLEEDGTIGSAYGYRWRHHFGRDQIGDLLKLLQKNPYSRHGVVIAWDPADDGLGSGTVKKNVPCPFSFTVNIIGGRLHLHSIIRSQDMMLGNPHDTAGFALLMMFLAQKLEVKPGKLTVSMSNAHVYENHYEQAREVINREISHDPIHIALPPESFSRAEQGDKALVSDIFSQIKSQYSPQPSLGRMKISEYENIDMMTI